MVLSKCCIHANFGQNRVISSGDIKHNITFWSKFSVFFVCSDLENKVKGHKVLTRALAYPSVISMQFLVKIKLSVQELLSILSLFGLNLAWFCLQ